MSGQDIIRFTLPVTVEKVSMLADRSVKTTTHSTQAIPDHEFFALHKAFQREGWLLFSTVPDDYEETDIPKEKVPNDRRSQATRIRNVLFRIWDQTTDHTEDSEAFYTRRTEQLIQRLKEELN